MGELRVPGPRGGEWRVSESRLGALAREYSRFAGGEDIEIEVTNGTVYAFGSELATLRLFRKFDSQFAYQGFSKNLGKFYFSPNGRS